MIHADHPLWRNYLRQRSRTYIWLLLLRVQDGLAALDPTAFLMVDAPEGYGYRQLSLSTFYPDWRADDPDDDPGVTIPWPPGEVFQVASIFHLAGVEEMPVEAIATTCRLPVATVCAILADPLYTRIGVWNDDPHTGVTRRLTVIAPTLFACCQQALQHL